MVGTGWKSQRESRRVVTVVEPEPTEVVGDRLLWMSFQVSPKPWNVWMFVFALVINRRRVDAGGTPEVPQLLEEMHVTVGSIFPMVATDPSASAKNRLTLSACVHHCSDW